jgi:hypothetical protein
MVATTEDKGIGGWFNSHVKEWADKNTVIKKIREKVDS